MSFPIAYFVPKDQYRSVHVFMFRNKSSFYGEDLLAPPPSFSPSTSIFHPRRLPALLNVPVIRSTDGQSLGTFSNRGAIDKNAFT